MRLARPILFLTALTLLVFRTPHLRAQSHPPVQLRDYTTQYYDLHTDLNIDAARESALRMTKMYEEYKRRTAGFSGDIHNRFPFYLYTHAEDYYTAGGLKDSVGVFMGIGDYGKLMAIAGEHPNPRTWHIIQHEGFHQFAAAVIRGELPPWVNEGLAEYFGEAVFTGDQFVAGLIPAQRAQRIQDSIKLGRFLPISQMMQLTHEEWNQSLEAANYDQAWSMVHFLAHGDNGKYQKAFVEFMQRLGHGQNYMNAWTSVFGTDVPAFQKKWEAWWLALPPDPTRQLYQKAELLTFTSYLARAFGQGQNFPTMDAFLDAARNNNLKMNPADWLPPNLLASALKKYDDLGPFTLNQPKKSLPRLLCTTDDGTQLIGSFTLMAGRVGPMNCTIIPPPTATKPHSSTSASP